MARIIQTYSLGLAEVELLEAYAVRHKMKKSRIIGNLLRDFLVLDSCKECIEIKLQREKTRPNAGHYGAHKIPGPKPAIFGYHFHGGNDAKFFVCVEHSGISKDNISHMQLVDKPFIRQGEQPDHKWEYTLINNLTKKEYNDYKECQQRGIAKFKELML